MPFNTARCLGSTAGSIIYYLSGNRRNIAMQNLACAFPEKSEAERKKIVKKLYRNLGGNFIEFVWLPRFKGKKIFNLAGVDGEKNLERAKAAGRGMIFLIPHFGNWELCSAVFPMLVPSAVAVYPQTNRLSDAVIDRIRRTNGLDTVPTGQAAKFALKWLKQGKAFGLLADQDIGGAGISVEFFGRPAATALGPVMLAKHTGAALFMAYMDREPNGKYIMRITEEIVLQNTGDNKKDMKENTLKWTKLLEEIIRRKPEEWFWVHRRWKNRGHEPDKILVVRLSSMGDVILATPVIRVLKTKNPDALISMAVKAQWAGVVRYNPYLYRVIEFEDKAQHSGFTGLLRFSAMVRREKFDLVIDLHANFRSRVISAVSGTRVLRYDKAVFERRDMVFRKKFPVKPTHVIERYLKTLEPLGISGIDIETKTQVFTSNAEENFALEFLKKHNMAKSCILVGIGPGGKYYTKRWLPERFSGLARVLSEKYKYGIIFFGDEKDGNIIEQVRAGAEVPGTDASGISILQTAALMKQCRVFIGNDSGLMHLAEALGVPVVAIFGPTVRHFGFYPVGLRSRIVERSLECRPCSLHGTDKCPDGTLACQAGISQDDIIAALKETGICRQ